MKKIHFLLSIIFLVTYTQFSLAQGMKKRKSPAAEVKASIANTNILINYSQPAVKGRKIWGGLVPYDKVWRTGANEATTITFDKDVKIAGKSLKAGKYALFTIPTQDKWTIIFNNKAKQWGSFNYKQSEDALRVEVTPQKSNSIVERMTFEVEDNEIMLKWDKLIVAFDVK